MFLTTLILVASARRASGCPDQLGCAWWGFGLEMGIVLVLFLGILLAIGDKSLKTIGDTTARNPLANNRNGRHLPTAGRHSALLPAPPHTAISQHAAQQVYVVKTRKYYYIVFTMY